MNTPSVSGQAAASSLGEGAFDRKGNSVAYKTTPHGQRECVNCTFHHPERKNRPCSVFKELQNKNKDCSAYIETDRQEPIVNTHKEGTHEQEARDH